MKVFFPEIKVSISYLKALLILLALKHFPIIAEKYFRPVDSNRCFVKQNPPYFPALRANYTKVASFGLKIWLIALIVIVCRDWPGKSAFTTFSRA